MAVSFPLFANKFKTCNMRLTTALVFALFFYAFPAPSTVQKNPDAVIGKWMSDEKNLEVQVYKAGAEYKAKVLWFDDSDDKTRPWNIRTDDKNPKKELRSRKIAGLEVLTGLVYDEEEDEWTGGTIYDSNSGKEWSAKVWLNKDKQLRVRGYWLLSLFGETMTFNKEP